MHPHTHTKSEPSLSFEVLARQKEKRVDAGYQGRVLEAVSLQMGFWNAPKPWDKAVLLRDMQVAGTTPNPCIFLCIP